MRGDEMLDRMELIEPEYIEEAEKAYKSFGYVKIKAAVIAACLLLVVTGAIISLQIGGSSSQTQGEFPPIIIAPDNQLDEPIEHSQIIFNETESVMDGSRKYIPGYFTEELSEQNSSVVLPAATTNLDISGFIGFDGDGNAVEVILEVTAPDYPESVAVSISQFQSPRMYDLESEPEVSVVNGKEFTVYRCTVTKNKIWLDGITEVNGYYLALFIETSPESIERDQKLFEAVIEYFSLYREGAPDIAAIKPQSIPEFFDIQLSMEEAQQNEEFGKYMLLAVPNGFTEESICRYKDQNSDYLSGLWTKGYDELSWRVSFFSDEDAGRITGVADKENYDLSLYPIPRAESVPDELREIVDNPIFIAEELTLEAVYARAYKTGETGDSNGWRMNFSVKFDDVVVTVRAKGTDPEWVYSQLKSMI